MGGSMDDLVAQQVEHHTFNVGVLGSSPSQVTRTKIPCPSVRVFYYLYVPNKP